MEFPTRLACKVLDVSRAGYYAWKKRNPSPRSIANETLLKEIKQTFLESRQTYGSPRIHAALKRKNISCGEHRVARLMQQNELISVRRRKFRPQTTDANHQLPVADNLLAQDFTASAPNQRWVGDITYVDTHEGWLYLAVVIDLFSRRVVGWAAGSRLTAELACRAFDMAIFRRGKPRELVYHSDRGVQYASSEFRNRLNAYQATPSMSRKGNCYDNAVAESFFDTLKVEFVHRYRFTSRQGARMLLADFIEEFYNINRIHSSLGFCSPVEYEQLNTRPSYNCVH